MFTFDFNDLITYASFAHYSGSNFIGLLYG
jgi:hypothetical protein